MDSLRKSPQASPVPEEQQDSSLSSTYAPAERSLEMAFFYPAKTQKRTISWKKTFWVLITAIFLTLFGIVAFFLYKSLSISHTIQNRNDVPASFFSDVRRLASSLIEKRPLLRGEADGRIDILLLAPQ